ncbi:hypothetical protein KCP76_12960 [Salmonella enterica subsp. enterica serovar Weltevreden]|nr:hypothetical protein KCP76_12960 [Salmonella enterica subsp. enterica serovar Weltevreden]
MADDTPAALPLRLVIDTLDHADTKRSSIRSVISAGGFLKAARITIPSLEVAAERRLPYFRDVFRLQ